MTFNSIKKVWTMAALVSLFQPVVALAAIGDAVKENVDEETVEAIEEKVDEVAEESVDVRQDVMLTVLNEAEEILAQIESELQNSEYASAETKSDGQALIDSAQAELDDLQQQAAAAETSDDLTAVRSDALAWLQENKDLAKEIAVDIYIDSLNAAMAANQEIIAGSKALVPYYERYGLDTTTYVQLIETAQASIDSAEGDIAAAESARTQDSLEAATRATAQATEAVAAVVVEADALYEQMPVE